MKKKFAQTFCVCDDPECCGYIQSYIVEHEADDKGNIIPGTDKILEEGPPTFADSTKEENLEQSRWLVEAGRKHQVHNLAQVEEQHFKDYGERLP